MKKTYQGLVVAFSLATLGHFCPSQTASAQPPGMSFGPGGPGMMIMGGGSERGSDRGGDRGRGSWSGGSGGFSGGFGGGGFGGGGFDPSSFITRMDTNGNGSIDPEEAQGPARFMLDRMARNNPKIDLSKPIPISAITESFQAMRSGGSPWGGGGSWGGSWGGENSDESVAGSSGGSLVPGFGVKLEKSPVPGFGSSSKTPPMKIEDQDLRDAEERMRRYDRNNDGSIDETEYRETRWSEQMSQWDTNKDGKLTREEVAVRYARRRLLSSNQPSPEQSRGGWEMRNRGDGRGDPQGGQRNEGDQKSTAVAHPFEKRASFRITDNAGNNPRPAGVPEWFARDDVNMDNQVSMSEFARKWDASTLEDFYKFDTNQDGFITLKECLAAVKKGFLKGSGSSSSSVASTDGGSSATDATSSAGPSSSTPSAPSAGGAPAAAGAIDDRMRQYAKRSIERADKDKNGFLTPDEFKSTNGASFADVDKDKNGKIDVDEYAVYRNSR
ncbi:MAG: hypothetical protein ACKOOI_21515 [Pirellula sp.]